MELSPGGVGTMDLKLTSIAEFFQDRVSEAIRNQRVEATTPTECYLVSAIGSLVSRPQHVDVRVTMEGAASIEEVRPQINTVVGDLLQSMDTLWKQIINRQVSLF